ncbi:MAG: biotin/lipoyl-containing protein [Ignavibacteria bacterium]
MNNSELKKIVIDDTLYITQITTKFANRKKYVPVNPKQLSAVIPGVILEVFVSKGQEIRRGEKLLLLEAMKMKNIILAQISGKIKAVYVKQGKMVVRGELLLEME